MRIITGTLGLHDKHTWSMSNPLRSVSKNFTEQVLATCVPTGYSFYIFMLLAEHLAVA